MRELLGDVCNDDGGTLNALRFEVDADVASVDGCFVGGYAVVPDEGGREDQDLTTVRRVGH